MAGGSIELYDIGTSGVWLGARLRRHEQSQSRLPL